MVVSIGQDRQIPSAQGIYAGESSQFVIGFNPGDYVSQISDYSCSTEGVTLALVEGSVNVLRVSLAEGITPGTVATIKFKNQSIIKVTAAEQLKVLKYAGWPNGEEENITIEDKSLKLNLVFNKEPVGVSSNDFSLRNNENNAFSLGEFGWDEEEEWWYLTTNCTLIPANWGSTAEVYFRDQLIGILYQN